MTQAVTESKRCASSAKATACFTRPVPGPDPLPGWLGLVGVVIGPLFLVSALEFLGRFEPTGWKLAGQLTPIAYIAWSLWLIAVGVAVAV
jgi:hypothetical protein